MEEDIRENIKRNMKIIEQEFKKISLRHDYFLADKGIPEIKELIDFSSKGLNWLFAIIVGTMLFILNNIDKFKVTSELSMPYKNFYVLSIICIGISSILLIFVLGRIYWLNYKAIRALANYTNYLKTYNRHFIELKIKKDMINEIVELAPSPELKKKMDEFIANFQDFVKRLDISTNLLEDYLIQFSSMSQLLGNIPVLLGSLVFYFLGLILITAYIILFIYNN